MQTAYINRVATAVPPYDVHDAFRRFAQSMLLDDRRNSLLFQRMADKSGIEHRYSCLAPSNLPEGDCVDAEGFYPRGDFPDTAARMQKFEQYAPPLAQEAVDRLQLGAERDRISHLVVTCCTGFSAPGLDLELVERCGLPSTVERTIVGFMGCYAAINALKLAHHIVRSEASARVLVVNLELCTLHLKDTTDLEQMLLFLLFGDGCAACVVSAEPVGIALDGFHALLVPSTRELITWNIRQSGFDMTLSGRVPGAIHDGLQEHGSEILAGASAASIDLWAVHPGGRTVLDAVERAFELGSTALMASREILRRYGNMSSATVMFVIDRLLRSGARGRTGCAMSFGPGLIAETMLFHTA
ncbi:type III polyketide synthase [Pseudaminobacter soli (ex Li et al. 2025)]|uniref:Type III polyketide synthase n=1 Tax=Pseudaminobacter soli (ex Li et al. 2025) TaxID=1295366 RepID=A0A2P7S3S5_9HYPH|nr:type III polyketide synthase [Mesorhizobium soli]PSJ57091.1 type III polyketide synthase [Mesorhizobium soli]